MAELVPAPFADLVTRLFREPALQDALFELPRRKWFIPAGDGPDLRARLHDRTAANPSGPAAGPHTQMAQNILLSYAAGGRILELKTVQINDRLDIPRPCIDMTTVGYNVEWSQELRIAESIREYVAGMMLVEMFRAEHAPACAGERGAVLYDLSVGYDLDGIQSPAVTGFLEAMRDARPVIATLRDQIPASFATARDLAYPPCISDSITLSTFHGCPAGEIERICEHLIAAHDFDVIVKMNPPMLGRERLEHLLHDTLGYTEIAVNPTAYSSGLAFDEAVDLVRRLTAFAGRHGRRLGCKFSNTLEVLNHRDFFPADTTVQYLSGQPLHVITMTLTEVFRDAVGSDVPISFSAGIDQFNFAAAAACGFVPITISSDLLRPGGYARLGGALQRLTAAMTRCGAATLDDFVLRHFGQGDVARAELGPAANSAAVVRRAGHLNTRLAAAAARDDDRYRAARNGKSPRRIDSHLVIFDCVTCDKCLPVCPNAANFIYPTPLVAFDAVTPVVLPDGRVQDGDSVRFEITRERQIACYADFCNECGNCDTFCPEYGGPYIEKPSFFGTRAAFEAAAPRDGFLIGDDTDRSGIVGRIRGHRYGLTFADDGRTADFDDGTIRACFRQSDHGVDGVTLLRPLSGPHAIAITVYHTLRHLHAGVLDRRFINQVNAGRHE